MSAFLEPAFRLCTAIDLIEESWNRSDGIRRDLIKEYEGVQAWLWVPNLYQLIEQSLKLLLQYKNQAPGPIHRLKDLYSRLDPDYTGTLDEVYIGYRDLYEYLPDKRLEAFLERADRGKGNETGYTTWRYLLLEGFPAQETESPTMHIGAMLEISVALRSIIRREIILEDKGIKPISIISRIEQSLISEFSLIATNYCSRDEIQAKVQSELAILPEIHCERMKYCRDLLLRNLFWAVGYMTSSPCLELDQENTEIMRAICERMMRDHKHDFLQYINCIEAGSIDLFEINESMSR